MYLSGSLERLDGTIGPGGSYVSNGGTYLSSFDVAGKYEAWFKTVYANDHPMLDNVMPSHIVVNSSMDEPSTVIVEQTGAGTSSANDPISSGSVSAKAGEPVYLEEPVVSEFFRVRTINGDGSNAGSITQTIRMKDRYY